MNFYLTRDEIAQAFSTPRARQRFEAMQQSVTDTGATVTANIDATQKMSEAAYLTLSPNAELPNERVLAVSPGLTLSVGVDNATIALDTTVPRSAGGFSITFTAEGDTNLVTPASGVLVSRDSQDTLTNKTLGEPLVTGLGDYVDDAAAAAGGVPVDGIYRNGSQLMIRVA